MMMACCSLLPAQAPLPYRCGFEAPAFAPGPLPQQGWGAESGSSVSVQRFVAYEAAAALALDAGGAIRQQLATTDSVVWIDGYQQAAPSPDLPDVSTLTSAAALVAFHTSGVLCFNGNGEGAGVWIATGAQADPTRWLRVTLRLDYGTRKYDCYVNGRLMLTGLGFVRNTAAQLGSLSIAAGGSLSYLDCLGISAAAPASLGQSAPAPDPTRAFTFQDTEQGWEFLSAFPSAGSATGTTAPAQLAIAANELFAFGFWGSIGWTVPTAAGSAYDLRWNVASDQTQTANVPWIRLRANLPSGQVANVVNVISPGDGPFSPGVAGREYRQVFQLPAPVAADGFNLNFDLLQFNGDDLIGAAIILREVAVLRHDAARFAGGTPIADFDFADGAQGWDFLGISPFGAPPPTCDVIAGGLRILSQSNLFTYGLLSHSGVDAGVPPTRLLRADMTVSAVVANGLLPPIMRLRLFDGANGHQSIELQTSPTGAANASPGATPRVYSLFYATSAGVGLDGSPTGMAMDLLNTDPSYDPTAIFDLHSAMLYQVTP